MQKFRKSKQLQELNAFFSVPALSLKNTFFNDFLVCINTYDNNMKTRCTLPMNIKDNKFWTYSVRFL